MGETGLSIRSGSWRFSYAITSEPQEGGGGVDSL